MHASRRLIAALTLVLAALSIAFAAAPASAEAGVHALRPADAKGAVAVYRLRGLEPRHIRRAELRRGKGKVRKLNLARVRRAAALGKLRVRIVRTSELRVKARRYRARVVRRAKRAQQRPSRRAAQRRDRLVRRVVLRVATRDSKRARLVIVTEVPAPTPAPPTATGASCAGTGSFAAGAWPAGCWRPYSATSPFNRPIGADPRLVANSQAIVSNVAGSGPANLVAGDAGTQWDYSHPIYWSRPSDPVFTLRCAEDWGTCDVEGAQVRIPDAARPAAGGDGHLTVIDQQSGWEYDLWQVRSKPAGGGVLTASWGGRTRIDGDGLGSNATAAHFGGAAGVIRAQELAAGRIDHALFLVIKCGSGGKVYPALGTGARCSDTTNAPAMGARFQLNMSGAEIDALQVPTWKKAILRAMAEYGMYFGDTGGPGFGLQFESGASYTSFGVEDAMVSFARQIGMKANGEGKFIFNVRDGIDWQSRLRVVDPCEAQGTC